MQGHLNSILSKCTFENSSHIIYIQTLSKVKSTKSIHAQIQIVPSIITAFVEKKKKSI